MYVIYQLKEDVSRGMNGFYQKMNNRICELECTGLLGMLLVLSLFTTSPSYAEPESSTCYALDYEISVLDYFKENTFDASSIDTLSGKTIRTIHYLQGGVFDSNNESEDNWLYRLLNNFHVDTKEYVIATQLLFAEGDILNPNIIHETERLLRTRHYLTEAFIVPTCIRGDEVDLIVITRDGWSFDFEGSFNVSGGDSAAGFGLKDGNIFGTGSSFSVGYEKDENRSGINYTYSTEHFLSTRVATHLSYADTSDGKNIIVGIDKPFFARNTPWASGVFYRDTTQALTIRSSDEIINEFNHNFQWSEVYLGVAVYTTSNSTHRILSGFTEEVNEFYFNENTQQGIPRNRDERYPWVAYQYREDHYAVYRNLNQIQRTEDVALGVTFGVRVGYGNEKTEGKVVRYKAYYQQIIDVDSKHLLSFNASVDGRNHVYTDSYDSTIFRSEVAYNIMQTSKNRWYASFAYDVGQDLPQYEELTIGGGNGLKGYPTDYQRGKKRFLATLERRYYSDWHWFNLVRVGAVAFVEAGKVWDGPVGHDNGTLADVGFGLRLSSSKVRVGNILHIDIAMPLAERSGIDRFQVLIKAEQQF